MRTSSWLFGSDSGTCTWCRHGRRGGRCPCSCTSTGGCGGPVGLVLVEVTSRGRLVDGVGTVVVAVTGRVRVDVPGRVRMEVLVTGSVVVVVPVRYPRLPQGVD